MAAGVVAVGLVNVLLALPQLRAEVAAVQAF